MKKYASLFLIALLGSTQPVWAHESHTHVSDQSVLAVAKDAAAQLTAKDQGLGFGKLPASWNDVPLKNAKIHKKYPDYYVVAVKNDIEKKTIYFVISSEGDVYDANFTGEFKNLK
jgi:hypothetical protein